MSGLNRSASLSYHERSESGSSPVSGSNNQLNSAGGAQYVADFSVRALTDLQFVKVSLAAVVSRVTIRELTPICKRTQLTNERGTRAPASGLGGAFGLPRVSLLKALPINPCFYPLNLVQAATPKHQGGAFKAHFGQSEPLRGCTQNGLTGSRVFSCFY